MKTIGKYILKSDFIPESEFWETGYWHLKSGTKVFLKEIYQDGTCLIEYIDCTFNIDIDELKKNLNP